MLLTKHRIDHAIAELRDEYLQPHQHPWIVAFSGGKDSTLVLHLVVEMLLSLAPSDRQRRVHVVCNDTQVESPLLITHTRAALDKVGRAGESLRLPMSVHVTTPAADQTFWCNLIGRGYPPPNRRFRWCTDRMKIGPTTRFVRDQVSAAGQVVLLVGVRRSESANRAKTIDRHTVEGQRLSPHQNLKSCMVFRPIERFDTDEVWATLLQRPVPWGGSHRNLITLYRNAGAGECPVVMDRSEAPACGGSSRFGCWTCTVVARDKSGEAMADAGFEEYEHLGEFRDYIRDLQHDRTKRQAEKRDGTVTFSQDELMPGPFTITARMEILDRLLDLQHRVGSTLITEDEVHIIKRIWAQDVVDMSRRWEEWRATMEACEVEEDQ